MAMLTSGIPSGCRSGDTSAGVAQEKSSQGIFPPGEQEGVVFEDVCECKASLSSPSSPGELQEKRGVN